MDEKRGAVEQAYEALRRKLIDTTMRNRLLNYRSSRTYGVEVSDEKSESVWRILVDNATSMSFTGPPDPPKKRGEAEGQDELLENYVPPPPPPGPSVDTEDQKLNTAVPYTNLQRRLLNTHRQATTQIDEQGINTLFIALGMLEWKESEASEKTVLAPLILIPVSLNRSQKGTFTVRHDESDIGSNLSLVEHMKSFGITLPEVPSDLSSFKPGRYFEQVEAAIEDQSGWVVHPDRIVLGFFSYVKSILYQDLKLDRWPVAGKPTEHEDIAATLGQGYATAVDRIGDDEPIDPIRPPSAAHEIFPADSSQIAAIMDSHGGQSLVIEGPPGTGKSQTIANLIGELVSQGKKVLFVSEKMAALEVVFRRLDEAGLAEACIEIHSQKQSRRAFYESIKHTWSLRSRLPDATATLERLVEVRNRLNAFVNELHMPLEPYGVAPRFLIAKSLSLPPIGEDELDSGYNGALFAQKSWLEVERSLPILEALQKKVAAIDRPKSHPFYASRLEYLGPAETLALETKLKESASALRTAVERSNSLADRLCVSHPETGKDLSTLQHCVEVAACAPPLDGVAVKTGTWKHESSRIEAAIVELKRFQVLRQKRLEEVTGSAWSDDLTWVRTAYDQHAAQFLKFLNGDYRRARAHLRSLLSTAAPQDPIGQRDLVRDLVEVRDLQKRIDEFASIG
jgi:DNA polymerase III delta prime subunit